jgi:endoglycosylceramidase
MRGALLGVTVILAVTAGCGGSAAPPPKLTLPPPAAGAVAPWVTTSQGRFVDSSTGKPVVLRGVDLTATTPDVYGRAVAMGANLVRIIASWSMVETRAPNGRHHFWNQSFLHGLDAEVAYFQRTHVNVLIDFHQFHWSPYFAKVECKPTAPACAASGVPGWYYADGRFPANSRGQADAQRAFWTSESARSVVDYAAFAGMMATRYARYPNVVGYEVFNEPHTGSLGDSTSATGTILQWQSQIRRVIRAADPTRTVFIMCRGGGEGVGTARLTAFGTLTHLALDYHDYYNGIPGVGLTPDGNNWTPSWLATHNQSGQAYTGTEAAQAAVLAVPLDRTRSWGIPLLIGEWGVHTGAPGAATYQSQMLDLFARHHVSWTRWNLARGGGFGLLDSFGNLSAEALQLQAALRSPG